MTLLGEIKKEVKTEKCTVCKSGLLQEHPNFLCCDNLKCKFVYFFENNYGEKESKFKNKK
jgi:hypothetical protein